MKNTGTHLLINLMSKIIVWATSDNGKGYTQKIGEFDEVEDIDIKICLFAPDVVIHFEMKHEKISNK